MTNKKPINLLIDTCSWFHLVSKSEVSKRLKLLKQWSNDGIVQLYCPEPLLDEWKKHRETQMVSIKNAMTNYKKSLKQNELFELDIDVLEPNYNIAERKLLSQIDIIDNLLNEAIFIPIEGRVLEICYQHKKGGLAPFHAKESENDARILFSTLHKLNSMDEKELYFLSHNHTDYSSPTSEDEIHPNISNEFPNISIKYFKKIEDGFSCFKDKGFPDLEVVAQKIKIKKEIFIDKKANIIDQIHSYLKSRFKEFGFLPKHLWAMHYPFVTKDIETMFPEAFVLNTDNEGVRDFLSTITVENNEIVFLDNDLYRNTENVLEKIKEILKALSFNLINRVSYQDSKDINSYPEKFPLPLLEQNACDCYLCSFNGFKFSNIFSRLPHEEKEEDNNLKKAYILYKIGKYKEASVLYSIISKTAIEKERLATSFIAQFNLVKLTTLVKYNYHQDIEANEILSEMELIDLDEELIVKAENSNKRALEYISSLKFFADAKDELLTLVGKIRNQYYSNSSGHNEYLRKLLYCYNELIGFLHYNQICVEGYSDFAAITELFIEGILASYASNDALRGKITHLNDWIIKLFVIYGKHNEIQTYVSRYKIKDLAYEAHSSKSTFFVDFHELLNSGKQLNENEKSDIFWRKYSAFVMNSLTMASLVKLSKEEINSIAKEVLSFLRLDGLKLHYYEFIQCLSYFISRRKDDIDSDILSEYFFFCLLDNNFKDNHFFYTLSDIIINRKEKFFANSKQLDLVISTYLEKAGENNGAKGIETTSILFANIGNDVVKEKIEKLVKTQLNDNFHAHTFYISSMYDIVKFDVDFFEKYSDYILSDLKVREKYLEYETFYTDRSVDEFLNYVFKYKIELSKETVQKIQGLGEYYVWITNMDDYDYTNFSPKWLHNYFTRYYKSKFKTSERLKEHILKLHKKDRDNKLANIYLDIYCHAELE